MMDPVDILPEEVWEFILELLGGKEWYACSQVCTKFQNLLSDLKKKKLMLFSAVFPIMFNKKFIGLTDALACRLVSRRWKFAVNNYWQSFDFRFSPTGSPIDVGTRVQMKEHFKTSQQVDVFMERFKSFSSTTNPFLLREVFFIESCYMDHDRVDDFWKGVTGRLLEKFGRHIWYCTMSTTGVMSMAYVYRQVLHKCVSLMPNLRTLVVILQPRATHFRFRPPLLQNEDEPGIWDVFQRFPLPRLKRLCHLEVRNLSPKLSFEILKCAGPESLVHFKYHDDRLPLEREEAYYEDCQQVLQGLVSLESVSIHSVDSSDSLPELLDVKWPLKRVVLGIPISDQSIGAKVTFPEVFATINKFEATLVHLELELCGNVTCDTNDEGELNNLRLKLPLLEFLQITAPGLAMGSLDFVADLKELRKLVLLLQRCSSVRENVEDSHDASLMQQSNLWEVLPKLAKLEVHLSGV